MIRHKVGKGFRRFFVGSSSANKEFILTPWIREHHGICNLKDCYRFKCHQDSGLVLSIENSYLESSPGNNR